MAVAKVIEVTAGSKKGLEDAIEQGMAKASDSLENIEGAWIQDIKVIGQERQDQRMARQYESDVRSELTTSWVTGVQIEIVADHVVRALSRQSDRKRAVLSRPRGALGLYHCRLSVTWPSSARPAAPRSHRHAGGRLRCAPMTAMCQRRA